MSNARHLRAGVLAGLALAAVGVPLAAQNLTADQIVERMEANQTYQSSRSVAVMEITDRFGTRTKRMSVVSAGADQSLIEFTNPEEAGQKILRLKDRIYLYFPEAEEVIQLRGAALRDSVAGSDFSYEDLTGEGGMLDTYTVTLSGEQTVDGHPTYLLHLEAKRRDVAYQLQDLSVDRELFVTRQAVLYSRQGRPVKEMRVTEVRQIDGRHVATGFEMVDAMRRTSRTVFRLEQLEIDVQIDPARFTLEALSR